MKERPILFSAPMVRAILDGRKTQTRRVVKPKALDVVPFIGVDNLPTGEFGVCKHHRGVIDEHIRCPYGQPGDRLWVRESWQDVHPLQVIDGRYSQEGRAGIPGPPGVTYRTIYRADGAYPRIHFDDQNGEHVAAWPYRAVCPGDSCTLRHVHPAESFTGWRPSIHMPRWASRLTLEVTGVRVERLQAISEADAKAEGCAPSWLDADDNETVHAQQMPTYKQGFARLWRDINGAGSWDANPWVWVVEFRRNEGEVLAA